MISANTTSVKVGLRKPSTHFVIWGRHLSPSSNGVRRGFLGAAMPGKDDGA